jgi:hypothetical protein
MLHKLLGGLGFASNLPLSPRDTNRAAQPALWITSTPVTSEANRPVLLPQLQDTDMYVVSITPVLNNCLRDFLPQMVTPCIMSGI